MSQTASGKQGRRRRRPTINQVFDLAIAVDQRLLRFGPAGRLCLLLGLEGDLAVLHRLQGRLVALLLVGQPHDQTVTLLCQGGKFGLLNTKAGLCPAQLLPQTGVGRCRNGSKERSNEEEVVKEDPTRLLSSRPESRGLHPVGALTRPHVR